MSASEENQKVSRQAVPHLMIPCPTAGWWKRLGLQVAGFAIIAYVFWTVREIWIPLGIAFLLALVLDPVVDRLEARGWSRVAGAALIYGLFLLLVIGGGFLLFPHVAKQVTQLQAAYDQYFPNRTPQGFKDSLLSMGLTESVARPLAHALYGFDTSTNRSSGQLVAFGMRYGSNLIWIIIVPIVAFYALRDFHLILAKGLLLVPPRFRDGVQTAVTEISGVFAKYMRATLLVSALNGVATWAILAIMGVEGALLIGIIAGIMYNVPYVGAILTTGLTAVIVFLQGGLNQMIIATGGTWFLQNVIFDYIIAPRILGGHVGLHPILSIMALLIGNLLMGILGMIIAVPIAACVQIGVLAMVPKLRHEISVDGSTEGHDTVESLQQENKDVHEKHDATTELHQNVSEAVEAIENEIEEVKEPSRKAKVL